MKLLYLLPLLFLGCASLPKPDPRDHDNTVVRDPRDKDTRVGFYSFYWNPRMDWHWDPRASQRMPNYGLVRPRGN